MPASGSSIAGHVQAAEHALRAREKALPEELQPYRPLIRWWLQHTVAGTTSSSASEATKGSLGSRVLRRPAKEFLSEGWGCAAVICCVAMRGEEPGAMKTDPDDFR